MMDSKPDPKIRPAGVRRRWTWKNGAGFVAATCAVPHRKSRQDQNDEVISRASYITAGTQVICPPSTIGARHGKTRCDLITAVIHGRLRHHHPPPRVLIREKTPSAGERADAVERMNSALTPARGRDRGGLDRARKAAHGDFAAGPDHPGTK